MEQRVKFRKKGDQRKFIDLVKDKLNCTSIRGILRFGIDIPYSTLINYHSEHMLLPNDLFEDLCYLSKINIKDLRVAYLESNWGQVRGGEKGIKTTMNRYPRKIKEWRALGSRNSPVIGNLKNIKKPVLNEQLAEFIGIYLGDGTMTNYQIRISGDFRYDKPYYSYLSKLVYGLFGIGVSIKKDKGVNTMNLIISSKRLCDFLNKDYGLNFGHKIRNKTRIPKKILNDKHLALACLRGLIDTDGSISRRGRNGSQFCIQFTSHNKLLLKQVYEIGKRERIFTFIDKTGTGTNNWENIKKYFELIGSSNLRHVVRFDLRTKGKTIYMKEVLDYYGKDLYKNINLPYKR
ncbi:MAG: LAGLIDADG family homing endonuclease [archaeon]